MSAIRAKKANKKRVPFGTLFLFALIKPWQLFDAGTIKSTANAVCCFVHLFELIIRKMYFEGAHNTICTDHAWDGESNILEAVLAFENSGAWQDRVLIIENGFDHAGSDHGNTRVGKALAVDYVVSNLNKLVFYGIMAELFGAVEILVKIIDRETGTARRGPSNESVVAVLTENIAVDVLRIYLILVSKDTAETIRFEHRTRTNDKVARIIKLGGYNISSNIKRVRDHDDHSGFRALYDLAHNGLHDLGIRAGQFQAIRRLTRADGRTGRDNDDVCIFAVIVVAEMELDVRAVDAARCMAEVFCLAPSLVLIQVDQSDFRCKLKVSDLVGNGRADVAGTDDDDFSSVVHVV